MRTEKILIGEIRAAVYETDEIGADSDEYGGYSDDYIDIGGG